MPRDFPARHPAESQQSVGASDAGPRVRQRQSVEKAIHEWEQVLAMFPNREDILHYMGRAWGKLQKFDKAISLLKKVLDLSPDNVQARLDLGVVLLSAKFYEHAIHELKNAQRLDPGNPMITQLLQDAQRLRNLYR
jgi:tetratricopeptide (TPR) repeat protein